MKKVTSVEPMDGFRLRLTFANGECRVFDATPYLDKGIFIQLRNPDYFRQVRAAYGAVVWPDEQDFAPETLYLESVPTETRKAG